MKKRLTTLLFLILSSIGVCQERNQSEKLVGFEIYLIEKFEWNENSFMTNKKNREKFGQFLYPDTFKQMPDSICHSYIDPNKIELSSEVLLTTSDIKYYSPKEFTIVLTDEGIKKISELNVSSFTTPFAIIANNKTFLIGWFWKLGSPYLVDKVYIQLGTGELLTPSNNYKKTTLQTELKLSFTGCGMDTRNTPDFIAGLTEYQE